MNIELCSFANFLGCVFNETIIGQLMRLKVIIKVTLCNVLIQLHLYFVCGTLIWQMKQRKSFRWLIIIFLTTFTDLNSLYLEIKSLQYINSNTFKYFDRKYPYMWLVLSKLHWNAVYYRSEQAILIFWNVI